MYYRYKSRKKDRTYLKYVFYFIITGVVVYTLYHYRNHLMFWKISHNRIVAEITSVAGISDPQTRFDKLKKLKGDLENYRDENSMDPVSYLFLSRICYSLGISGMANDFTDIYLNEANVNLSPESGKYLTESIKNSLKAIALLDGKEIDNDDIFILAGACFFTGYYDNSEIYNMLKGYVMNAEKISSANARFFSIICIKADKVEEGLSFLQSKGDVESNVKGRLLWAKALRDAMKNTEAIIAFQKILKSAEDSVSQKIAYSNLGRIYYDQHLYKESIDQYNAALLLEDDPGCRIWLGKNYMALGEKDKAKAVWTDVLNADNSNEEAKKLLGMIQ
jgi:tetratricopeptide (TPR) repeat protein